MMQGVFGYRIVAYRIKMMRQTHNEPVFILSCERSGSTLLRYIIDTHPEIACPSHLYLGSVCEGLNRMLMGTVAQNRGDLDEAGKKAFVIGETKNILSHIMESYIKPKNKKMWCEKTPMNLDYLSLLEDHFPDAKYICLYRHCMDVVHSSINLSKFRFLPEHVPYVHRNPESIISAMLENWLDKTNRLLEFEAAHPGRCFRVKYESLVMQPEATLASLFGFLGLEWPDDLLDRVFEVAHDKGEGDGRAALSSKIRKDSVGNGIEVPKSGISKKFIKEIDRLLLDLNYPGLDAYYADRFKPDQHKPEIGELFHGRFMDSIKRNRQRYPELKGVFKVVLKDSGAWVIDLSEQEASIAEGNLKSDFTLRFSEALLFDMVNGIRNAVDAIYQGEIEIEGDYDAELLMNFGRLVLS